MPTITVDGPIIKSLDKKRILVRKLTESARDVYEIDDIVVLIRENPPENVGIKGELLIDRIKK
ncbi:MAG: tautomerase family protein [Candidatus Marinimicrobia bacterium]|nr:tautomerase family protein [Candidatus Neomarinimicrobiota bacterium]